MDLLSDKQKVSAHDTAILESFLFLKGDPASCQEIREKFNWTEEKTELVLQQLAVQLSAAERGIMLHRRAAMVQLVTKPELYEMLRTVQPNVLKLKPMSMEVLAVVAYRQPVTKQEIEQIRGVSSDRLLEQLQQLGLVEEKGRLNGPGKPILYGTTSHFLTCTGISSLEELLAELPESWKAKLEEQDGTLAESTE